MFPIKLQCQETNQRWKQAGTMTPGQMQQVEGPRALPVSGWSPQGQTLQSLGCQPLNADRQDTSDRTPARVHTWPTAPKRHLSPQQQLSPQPPPCWLPGGLRPLSVLGPAGRYSAESTLLCNGAKGQAYGSPAPLCQGLPGAQHCLPVLL